MKKIAPTKAEIALLEPFVGLALAHIQVPSSREEFASATAEIEAAGIVGFDTESKPTFVTGDVSAGPHVVQFALHDKAYLFQLHRAEGHPFLIGLLQSEQLIKVGFGLKSDSGQIYAKLGIHIGAVVDLNKVFRMGGYQKEMGVRTSVALVFKSALCQVEEGHYLQLVANRTHSAANALRGERCLRGTQSTGGLGLAPRRAAHHGPERAQT